MSIWYLRTSIGVLGSCWVLNVGFLKHGIAQPTMKEGGAAMTRATVLDSWETGKASHVDPV